MERESERIIEISTFAQLRRQVGIASGGSSLFVQRDPNKKQAPWHAESDSSSKDRLVPAIVGTPR